MTLTSLTWASAERSSALRKVARRLLSTASEKCRWIAIEKCRSVAVEDETDGLVRRRRLEVLEPVGASDRAFPDLDHAVWG